MCRRPSCFSEIGTIHVKDDKDVGKLRKGSLFSFRTSPSTAGGCKNCEDLVARPTRGASWLSLWPSARRIECLKQNSQWRTECAGEILDEMKMWCDDGKHTRKVSGSCYPFPAGRDGFERAREARYSCTCERFLILHRIETITLCRVVMVSHMLQPGHQ